MIRLDDFVLVGPGSEWFWVMLQFVALAGTGVAIYRQLRAQRSASLFEHMSEWDQEWSSPPMLRAKLDLMLELQHREPSAGIPLHADSVPDFFERVGYLVSRGHINAEDFWEDGAWYEVEFYWGVLEPYIRNDRAASPGQVAYRWFEWLEREMRRIDVRKRQPRPPFDQASRDAQIVNRIETIELMLERESSDWPRRRPRSTKHR